MNERTRYQQFQPEDRITRQSMCQQSLSTQAMARMLGRSAWSDDRIGRALDMLFGADRATLLTEVVLAVAQRFGAPAAVAQCSTSIPLCGQYRQAGSRGVRGRSAPAMACGYSKNVAAAVMCPASRAARRGRLVPVIDTT